MNEDCHNDFHLAVKTFGLRVEDYGVQEIGAMVSRYRTTPNAARRRAKLEIRRLRRAERKQKVRRVTSHSLLCRQAMRRCRRAKVTREAVITLISELTTVLQSWPDDIVHVLLNFDAEETQAL